MRQAIVFVTPLFLVLASCAKENRSEQKALATSTASAAPSAKPRAEIGKVAIERKPLTDEQRRAGKAYAAALSEGRAATRAKSYDAAVSAFDKALTHVPADARAIAERGYAHLLAKRLDAAQKDLERAVDSTNDASVLGPAFFNLGLVAEARGDAEGARVAFARSNTLKPTKAALAKLEGKSSCVADITRPERKAQIASTFSDAYDAMKAAWLRKFSAPELRTDPKPASEEAIKKSLCGDKCTGAGPWTVTFPEFGSLVTFAIAPTADNKLALYELGATENIGCMVATDDTIVKTGPLVHVHEVVTVHGREWMDEKGEGCTPTFEEGSTCLNPCGPVSWEAREYVLDTTKQTVAVVVSEQGEFTRGGSGKTEGPSLAAKVVVKESDGAVTVRGGGCNVDFDFKHAK